MESYGLPRGSAVNYGASGFPPWVYELADRFGLKASTYPGHQENNRPDIGAAPNPQRLNRGIDWAGPPEKMLAFARWLRDTEPLGIEMVIYQDPRTGERVGWPSFVDYSSDYGGHTDHVHTRQSQSLIAGEFKPKLTNMDRYALQVIKAGRDLGISPRGIVIALSVPFVESGWKMYANKNIPESLALPHDAVGGDHDSNGLFQQRMAWGPLSCTMDAYCSATLFYKGGAQGQRGLKAFDYDHGDMGTIAADVQQPAKQYRYRYGERMAEAQALYDRLSSTTTQEDDMAQVPQDQWDRLYHLFTDPVPSQSALRMPGEGLVGSVVQLVRNIDGMVHPMLVELLARLGDPNEITRLHAVADCLDADRARDAALAATILERIASGDPVLVTNPAVQVAPVATAVQAAIPVPATVNGSTTGALIGAAYDALAALQLSTGLPVEAKAPMEALIGVLKTYPKDET